MPDLPKPRIRVGVSLRTGKLYTLAARTALAQHEMRRAVAHLSPSADSAYETHDLFGRIRREEGWADG